MAEELITRGLIETVEVRAINEEARTAEFVAATENGVMTWGGREHLRMSGIRLQRYRSNPVVLDAHNRWSAGSVIGRSAVKVEGKQLICTIEFAKTARAEEIWTLVKGGFLRALSVGFSPDRSKMLRIAEGETDGEGENAVSGPATIIRQWELFEISVVPVPADPDTLKRSFLDGYANESALITRGLINILERLNAARKDQEMAQETAPTGGEGKPTNDEKREVPTAPVAQTAIETLRRDIQALAPTSLPEADRARMIDELVIEGATVDVARKRFREELEKATPPAGTPEPKTEARTETRRTTKDLSERELVNALIG